MHLKGAIFTRLITLADLCRNAVLPIGTLGRRLLSHKTPMKKKHNNSMRASAVQITFPVTLVLLSAVLLTLGGAPARNQIEREPGASVSLQNPKHRTAVSESSAAAKQTNTRK